MTDTTVQDALRAALRDRRLLTHPFYLRWTRGELSLDDLRSYAEQYRFFEAELPAVLRRVRDDAADETVAATVQRNLDDETGVHGVSHLALFERFAAALGADPEATPSAATAELLGVYRTAAATSPGAGLAAVLAYEAQAAEIAESKATGLLDHYSMPAEDIAFWQVHATTDVAHAQWAGDAVGRLDIGADQVWASARAAADAWWAFLDDREAEALAAT